MGQEGALQPVDDAVVEDQGVRNAVHPESQRLQRRAGAQTEGRDTHCRTNGSDPCITSPEVATLSGKKRTQMAPLGAIEVDVDGELEQPGTGVGQQVGERCDFAVVRISV